jgi:hypothetical protein
VFLDFYEEPLVLALFIKELEWFQFHTKMEPWVWFWSGVFKKIMQILVLALEIKPHSSSGYETLYTTMTHVSSSSLDMISIILESIGHCKFTNKE